MKVLSSKQMYDIDQKTIKDFRIDDLILMENAGITTVHSILKKYPDKRSSAIFIGSGNNGGDGLVIGRHLFFNNYRVSLFYAGDKRKATKNNKKNFSICRKLNIPIYIIDDTKKFKKYRELINNHDIMIDALLGVGLKAPLKGVYLEIIRYLNLIKDRIKIAVDIPTGLFADSPDIKTEVFKADLTVTFGAPKISHILSPAQDYVGELEIKNIGFPEELLEDHGLKINLITKDAVGKYLPDRISYYHKNDFGNVTIFAGSTGKSGAAILASTASIRSGAGIVTTVTPKEINEVLENNLIEVMTHPVDLNNTEESFKASQMLFENADVILAGCGITTEKKAELFLRKILNLQDKVIVLDADALNIIANDLNMLNKDNKYILTPHIGEMCRLLKKDKEEIINTRIKISQDFASQYNIILVLKSSETLVVSPEKEVYIDNAGNEGMATAGSGDVLSGIIAGIVAQNLKQNKSIFSSVITGVFLHSLSGKFAKQEKGSHSLIAMDLINNLHKAINYAGTP